MEEHPAESMKREEMKQETYSYYFETINLSRRTMHYTSCAISITNMS